jgi:hypothetical protein
MPGVNEVLQKTGTNPNTMLGGKRSKWLAHVKKTMKANKGKSLKAVLKMAKKTYKGGASTLSPALVGGRRNKTRRAGRHA